MQSVNSKPILGFALVFTILLSSCVTNKRFIYLQDKGNVKMDSAQHIQVPSYNYKIQKGDKPLVKIGNKELPLSAQKLDEIQHKLSIRFKA